MDEIMSLFKIPEEHPVVQLQWWNYFPMNWMLAPVVPILNYIYWFDFDIFHVPWNAFWYVVVAILAVITLIIIFDVFDLVIPSILISWWVGDLFKKIWDVIFKPINAVFDFFFPFKNGILFLLGLMGAYSYWFFVEVLEGE